MIVSYLPIKTFEWMSLGIIIVLIVIKLVQRIRFSSQFNRIPGPKAYPIIGNVLDLAGKSTTDFFKLVNEQCSKHKGSFVLWIGTVPKVYIYSPDLTQVVFSSTEHIAKSDEYTLLDDWLGTGLITSAGTKWRHRRKMLTPAFHYNILETMIEPIQKIAFILAERLDQEDNKGDFDIFQSVKLAGLDIVGATTMGYDIGAQMNLNSSYTHAIEKVAMISTKRFITPWLQYDTIFKRTSDGKEYHKNLNIIQEFDLKIIKERRSELQKQQNVHYNVDETKDPSEKKRPVAFLDLCLQLPELSDNDIKEEVETFMFAGHDTTSGVASWTLYSLGHHPEMQEKIIQEAENVGFYNGYPSLQTLASMEYLERCIKESLRLYPPVPVIGRQLYEPLKLPNGTVPAGASILINLFAQHRDPEYFPNPLKYDPDRFLVKMTHPYAHVPFSAGPRNCIGQKVAMISLKVLIATVLKRHQIISTVKPEDLKLTQNIVLENEGGLKLSIKPRK